MLRLPHLLLAGAIALGAAWPPAASAQSRTAYTLAATSLRAVPSPGGHVVGAVARGWAVEVGGCARRWCSVSVRGRSGYLPERVLGASGQEQPVAVEAVGRGYTNSRGEHVRSPQRSLGGVPAGASAHCRDGTYSFSRSRRGTCSHHGGVGEWL